MDYLAGREAEAAALEQYLLATLSGQFRVLLLAGEPGIGKTHLLRYLAEQARRVRVTVLWGGASETEGMPPYLPFLESVGSYIRDAPAEKLRRQSGAAAPILATVLPELTLRLGQLPTGYPLPPEQARYRLFQAVGEFLTAMANDSPLLLILDDLHWADTATLDLLAHLANQLQTTPILIVGAYRLAETEQHPAFRRCVAELTRRRVLITMNIGPLNQAGVATLAAAFLPHPPSAPLINWLYHHSEGNPFFAEELLRDALESGRISHTNHQTVIVDPVLPRSLPPGISGAVQQRLTRLPAHVITILQTAAVVGRRVSLPLLAAVVGENEVHLARTLQIAVQTHLLREETEGHYTFSHDIIRACLLNQLLSIEQQHLHHRIGQVLLNQPDNPERLASLAYHFAHSQDRKQGANFALQAAAQAMSSYAFEEALAHFRLADALLPTPDPRRGEMWLGLGEAARATGASREAAQAFTLAQSWFRQRNELLLAGRAAHGRGRAWWQLESITEAQAAFEEALRLLEPFPNRERVAVLVDLANLLTLTRLQYEQGQLYSQEALTLARQLDDRQLLAMVDRTMGTLLARSDDLGRGLALLEEALILAVAYNDPAEAAECCGFLAVAYVWAARFQDAERAARQMITYAGQAHMVYPLRHVYIILAILVGWRGQLEEANRMLEDAAAIAADLDNPEVTAYLEFGRGTLALAQGETVAAEQAFARLITGLRQVSPGGVTWFLGLLGLSQAMQGKEAEARACLVDLNTLVATMPTNANATLGPLSQMSLIALTLNDRAWLKRLYPRLQRFRGQYYDALIDWELGMMATQEKDFAAAEQYLASAEATARRENIVFELVNVLSARADLVLVQGGLEAVTQAGQYLTEGHTLMQKIGAGKRADALAQRLLTLLRPSTISPPLPAGLSSREVEVLHLVAEGYSNRQIAAALVISEKTVANHMTHIFNKLAVDNRAAAVAFAARYKLL